MTGMEPEIQCWKGTYRCVKWEALCNTEARQAKLKEQDLRDIAAAWCCYIVLAEPLVTPEAWEKLWATAPGTFVDYDLEGNGSALLHEKLTVELAEPVRCIRIAWDYMHLWDHEAGYEYDLSHVLFDLRKSIDACWELGLMREVPV